MWRRGLERRPFGRFLCPLAGFNRNGVDIFDQVLERGRKKTVLTACNFIRKS